MNGTKKAFRLVVKRETGIGYANHQTGGSKREVCSMWVVLSLLPDRMHHDQWRRLL
jgi:hypothetical protein